MNWKMLAIGLASLIGVGAVIGVTVIVTQHHMAASAPQDTSASLPATSATNVSPSAPPMTPVAQQDDAAAEHLREVKAECRQIANEKVKERTGEVIKDSAIGGLIGAGTGSAGGAIAGGGSGAGKGAAIGALVGVVGGAVYGANTNTKEAIFKKAYHDCMRSHS